MAQLLPVMVLIFITFWWCVGTTAYIYSQSTLNSEAWVFMAVAFGLIYLCIAH